MTTSPPSLDEYRAQVIDAIEQESIRLARITPPDNHQLGVLAIAAAHMLAAETIFRTTHPSGPKHAAEQFYAMADYIVGEGI